MMVRAGVAAGVLLVAHAVLAGRAGAQQDVTPPEVLDVMLSTLSIDTSAADQVVTALIDFTDDLSGIDAFGFCAERPSGGFVECCANEEIIIGGPMSGVLQCRFTFDQFREFGDYRLDLELRDRVGNRTRLNTIELAQRGLPSVISNQPGSTASDADDDGTPDVSDNCPADPNADQADRDIDNLGDVCDLCPDYRSSNNGDFDGNGIGNVCECGDQTQDAVVNVLDLVGINLAIFGAVQTSPLCDANNDGLCNVSDIVAANQKIFGRPAYCERYPPPPGP